MKVENALSLNLRFPVAYAFVRSLLWAKLTFATTVNLMYFKGNKMRQGLALFLKIDICGWFLLVTSC